METEVVTGNGSTAPTTDALNLPVMLTVEEAAAFLRLDKKTVYEAIRAKKFPGRKVGARYCIYRDALLGWLMCDVPNVAGGVR